MLNISKRLTLSGNSTVNGIVASSFSATIDSDNPEKVSLTNTSLTSGADSESRQQVRDDYDKFLKTVYATQDEMLSEKSAE